MSLADEPIPVYTDLKSLYGSLGSSLNHAERWDNLTREFTERFGYPPTYIARAPGRVNLIGEHIDYALFGVLPAAIEQDILIACAPRKPTPGNTDVRDQPGSVVAENLDSKYARQVFAPTFQAQATGAESGEKASEGWHLDIDTKELRWESYVKAGYYGVLSHYFPNQNTAAVPVNLLVTGSVPAGSGVSSSAAMVVSSTLAFLAVNNKLEREPDSDHTPLNKGDLVKMAMENEKRVGVNSGGMDQAASVMSNPSSALYIAFYPTLSATPAPLPPRARFIISNSLVVSDKATTAKHRYNLRVVETLVGARILARKLHVKLHDIVTESGNVKKKYEKVTYREVLGRIVGEIQGCGPGGDMGAQALMVALKSILKKLECLLPKGVTETDAGGNENRVGLGGKELGVTMEEMIEMSGLSSKVFHEVYLSWVEVEATHFQLYKRAKHVFSEALRVLQFRKICLDSSSSLPFKPSTTLSTATTPELEKLGKLMNESQNSCQDFFECSCSELDLLTRLCRDAGAFGSRLTGAGWGGCVVSLVAEDQVDSFIETIKQTYPPYKDIKGEQLNQAIFATRPSSGACVYKVT